MKRFKRIVNGFIAIAVSQIPLLFPDERIMLAVFIIGLLFIALITYVILNFLYH